MNRRPEMIPPLFHTVSPIQPPPLRGTSFHRKEGASTRAPSYGRGCRAQRGGVGFLFGRRSGALVSDALETISPLFFIPPEPYPARFARHLPHAGKALFGDSGALASQPFPLGKGDRAAVDRVLSYIVDLRHISSLSFIPLSPSNLRPFGAPPSIGRRECPREPLPLEGARGAARRGWLLFSAALGCSRIIAHLRRSPFSFSYR